MAKNRKTPDMNLPVWFDGQNINEALFCEEFLQERRIIFANGAFFTPDGRVTDDLPLRGEIYEKRKFCAVNNIPRKITNILEVLKLEAQEPDFPPEQDRIHVANGTLMLNGTFTEGKPAIVRSRLPIAYKPDAPAPVIWLNFLDGLLHAEDIPTLQEFIGYCLIPSNKGQRMMVIKGNGGEGKSQIGAVLSAIFGTNMKDGSIGKISENRFARADLEHILLCVDDDMRMEALRQTNYVKSIVTAQGKMDLERKGKQSYQGWMFARLLAFSNGDLQALYDRSDGFYRRQLVLTTKEKPMDRADDPDLAEKMKAEAEGIFLWAFEGLQRLVANNFKFTESDRIQENREAVKRDNNNIFDFTIARTAANVKNGGRTPVAGMVHAVVLLLILVVLMPCASWIPMPTIAAILFMVAYNMCQWRTFVRLTKTAPKSDIAVLVLTFFLTVIFDLVVAIEIGMLLSCLLFMKRMSDETGVRSWLYVEEVEEQKRKAQEVRKAKKAGKELSVEEAQLLAAAAEDEEAAMKEQARLREIPRELAVYEITGPLFFGAADRINQIETREETKCLVLRMRAVPAVDSTAMNSMVALYERCQKNGVTLILSHVNEQPMHVMEKAGFVDMVGRDHFCPNIEAALDHADEVLGK